MRRLSRRATAAARIAIVIGLIAMAAAAEHPCLLFRAADIPALQERAAREPWRTMASNVLAQLPTLTVDPTAEYAVRCERIAEIASAAALAWLVDPPGRPAHLALLAEDLDRLAPLLAERDLRHPDDWPQNVPLARACFQGLLALDLVRDDLPAARREAIERAIDGIVGSLSRTAFVSSRWACAGAWARYRGDVAAFAEAKAQYRRFLDSEITPGGVIATGPYYAVARYLASGRDQKWLFMDILEAAGEDDYYDAPRYRHAHEWLMGYAFTPDGREWSFGDTDPDEQPTQWVSWCAAFWRTPRFGVEAGRLAAWRVGDAQPFGDFATYVLMDRAMPTPRAPESRVFPDGGAWLLERGAPPRGLGVALWSPIEAVGGPDGHAHKDVNAIHLVGYGKHLLRNTGYAGWDEGAYGADWAYIHDQAIGNNVALIDDVDHVDVRGGGIIESLVGGMVEYARADSGPALPNGKHRRDLLLVQPEPGAPGYIALVDEVAPAVGAGRAVIALHPASAAVSSAEAGRDYAWDLGDGVGLSILLATPPDAVALRDGALAGAAGLLGRCLVSTYACVGGRGIVTLIQPSDATDPVRPMARLAGPAWTGARLRAGDGVEDLVIESDGVATLAEGGLRGRGPHGVVAHAIGRARRLVLPCRHAAAPRRRRFRGLGAGHDADGRLGGRRARGRRGRDRPATARHHRRPCRWRACRAHRSWRRMDRHPDRRRCPCAGDRSRAAPRGGRAMTTDAPIRTAIIGLGRAGWEIHVAGLRGRDDYRIVACVDPEPERRREAELIAGCRAYASVDELLAAPHGAELAIVCTSSDTHVPLAIRLLDAGLHVLAEKPMATGPEQAAHMVAAARAARTFYAVHQNLRFGAEFRQLRRLIASGAVGEPFLVKLAWTSFARRNDWQTLRRFGGGTLNNSGAHALDLCVVLMDAPIVDVWADLRAVATAGDAEDHAKLMLRGANGRVIDVELSSGMAAEQRGWQVFGRLGSIVRDGDAFVVRSLDPRELPPLEVQPTLAVPGRRYGVVGGEELRWREERVPAAPPEMALDLYAELWRAIRRGAPFEITLDQLAEQMRINALARAASRAARPAAR
ncbi:MAG TPA: Gfo/Idh/MocA family oxidoreductase [Planctomycetota bacterium]|nr:Gfo/Idh/MocA family oxidoreductase [Planctomycetota bacterium]